MSAMEIKVPDIGGFTDVSVIDVMIEVGQKIEVDAPLITLETDKAAMDVPAPAAGVVRQVSVKKGDKVSQGAVILMLEDDSAPPAPAAKPPPPSAEAAAAPAPKVAPAPAPAAPPASATAHAAPRGPVSIDEIGFSKAMQVPRSASSRVNSELTLPG